MVRAMARGGAPALRADVPSLLILVLAAGTVVLAAVVDPANWWEVAGLVVAGLLLAVRVLWGLPLVVLTLGMVAAVAASQWGGGLEPGMFLLSLLGVALTGWQALTWRIGALVLVAAVTPLAVMVLPTGHTLNGVLWVLGVLFPACLGWAFRRQMLLTEQLEATRRALAEQAVLEERQQIARDVHDLVGHGLAGMMVQVTSARHVLLRDAAAAEEALDSAEDIGRRSMQELRRTVASLREGSEPVTTPVPGLSDVASLVDTFRAAGGFVEHRVSGDHDRVDPMVGLTLYRIAQEALANARHHAPHASTVVSTMVEERRALLEVETRGAVRRPATDDGRPRFGVQGMRERADVLGADFSAGPTASGWLVRCQVRLVDGIRPPASAPADDASTGKRVRP